MAISDKNIVITPNIGQTNDPTIVFSGADSTTSAQNISLKVYPTSNGTLSFEGSAGQLFSITNSLSGSIFSVNDVSGIPSIEVLDNGTVKLAQYSGNVGIGVSTPSTKLEIAGDVKINGTTETLSKTSTVEGWTYSGKNISISTQETTSRGLSFSTDGTKMYIVGQTNDTVYQYTLSTAFDVSTATYASKSVSILAQDTSSTSLYFKNDGTAFYMLGDTNDTVYQYTLATAWDVSTATYATKSFSVTTQETAPSGLEISTDGTKMYVIGTTNDTVYQYTLATAWDVSTATYASKSFSVTTFDGTPSGIEFNNDGSKMYVIGSGYDCVIEYTLTTAWDVSTAVYSDRLIIALGVSIINPLTVLNNNNPTDIYTDFTNNVAYILDQNTNRVYQFTTNTTPLKVTGNKIVVNPVAYFKNDIETLGSIRALGFLEVTNAAILSSTLNVGGTLTASGALTAASTISLNGSASSVTTISGSATTGTTTIGGTTQTGAITVGQSTAAQTLNLATGATTAATTKTVNIGINGVSTSITNVNIGNSAGTSTVTVGSTVETSNVYLGTGVNASGVTKTIGIGTNGVSGSTTNITLGSSVQGALGKTIANQGIQAGSNGTPIYQTKLDFGSDVAATWRKLTTVSLGTGSYQTAGYKIDIVDANANHAVQGSINADKYTYYVACIRTEGTTQDTPDACYISGPASHIRAVKISTGNYEIQVSNEQQYQEYLITVQLYTENGGTNAATYYDGSAVGSAGIATYTAAVGSATDWFQQVRVASSGSGDALRITQTGTGNALVVEDEANPDTTPFVIKADGNIVIGFTAQVGGAQFNPRLEIVGSDSSTSGIGQFYYNNNSGAARYQFNKTRATAPAGHVIVQNNDELGMLTFAGSDGTGYIRGALIAAYVDGTPGTNDMPGRLVFSTTADGASAPTEAMRIDASGNVGIGTASPTAKLDVVGSAKISGDLTVSGNITINGTTTTINSNTITVDDKNIELGSVPSSTISTTGTVGSISGTGPWTATITNMTTTAGLIIGSAISATAGTGTLYGGSPSSVVVASIIDSTSITYTVTGGTTPTAGTITTITTTGSTDVTASGGGITLKGTTDKSITWDATNGWTSTEIFNLVSGKTYKINGTDVLSSTTLGSTVINSSLTSVGLTGTTGIVGLATTGAISGVTIGSGLTLSGGILSFNGAASLGIVDDNTTNATYYPIFSIDTSGTSAKVSSTKLQFNPSTGTLTVTDLNTVSDKSLKTNINTIDNSIDILSQLRGVSFDWVETGKKSYGVIAQELEEILPELVSVNSEGKKAVNYIPIIGFLIEAIKQQQNQINELNTKINKA